MDWARLIDKQALARLLPADHARYALPVQESLIVFLEGLPEEAQQEILADQAQLPVTVSFSQRLVQLAQRCPVLHKLGQVLARDQRIDLELRQELRRLESMPPATGVEAIRATLVDELGPLESLGITLPSPPLAEASVAVVIPFTSASSTGLRQGVFKVLKPGIEERLHLEMDLLGTVAAHLDARMHEWNIPVLDYQGTFGQVREKLGSELRLDEEQRHLAAAAQVYEEVPYVQIPHLFEWCTPRVTSMERVFGRKVTDYHFKSPRERARLAGRLLQALVAQPIFCRSGEALFHGDPHAGNLFFTDDHRIALLDWSLAGKLGETQRSTLVQVVLSAVCLRGDRLVEQLIALDERGQYDRAALARCVDHWLRRMRWGHFPGLSWLVGLLDDAAQTTQLSFSSDMLLFRKSLHMVSGVQAEIYPSSALLDEMLLWEFVRHIISEWPARWITPLTSRSFSTRLSNWDLTQAVCLTPLAVCRYWREMARDVAGRSTDNHPTPEANGIPVV